MLNRHGFRLRKITKGGEDKHLFTFVSHMVCESL